MKCERCGQNEVNFYYKSNVNGNVTEQHLCSKCAEELGYTKQMSSLGSMRSMFGGMDSMFNRMLGGFFSDMPSLWGRSFFEPMTRYAMPAAQPQTEQGTQVQEPQREVGANPELVRRRELNALREEMNLCIKEENFEKAAEIRDKIRSLENGGENKE